MQPRGVGIRLSTAQRETFEYFAFGERRSVRESCRLAGIAKGTGLALHRTIRNRMAGV